MAEGVGLSDHMPPAFDQALRESTPHADELEERRAIANHAPSPRTFAVHTDESGPLAVGMSAAAGDLAGIFLMRTVPSARRQGHARQVLRALLAWARANGAANAFLQVDGDNAPAVALYEGEGFAALTSYCFWRRAH
jgi:ribosomal protein S18 acetylase RimI-like enzyme